jgi:hypothetical protein
MLLVATLAVAVAKADALTIVVSGDPGTSEPFGVNGGMGGAADAVAISTEATNRATATGGRGGDGVEALGGAGGAATATAETSVAAPASAIAAATGGGGGNASGFRRTAGEGGDASASARASGSGGSQARAFATGGRGGSGGFQAFGGGGDDAVRADAVSGSDPVALTLEQRATGGARGNGGEDGAAVSTGDFDNAAGGDLHVLLAATGGNAHVGGSATSSAAGDAALEAVARTAGAFRFDPLLAHATGSGDARAFLEAERFGAGATLSLANQVDAFADGGGAVALRQTAKAEGASESILDVTKSAALLDLEANAEGGEASIFVRGSNDAGDLRMSGEARGDARSDDPGPRDGIAVFEAVTTGDGHDIEIGLPGRPARATGAGANRPREAGAGRIEARAEALGNSSVRIDVIAEGGDHDDFHGGDAFANAEGRGGGTESVEVLATALGEGFYSVGGDAGADVLALGQGAVHGRAVAHGGIHDSAVPGSAAVARARGIGSGGSVEAVASSTRLFGGWRADDEQAGRITVSLAAPVSGDIALSASSRTVGFAPEAEDPALDGVIRSAYQPEASLLDAAFAGNPRAAAAPAPTPRLFALVEFEARSGGGHAKAFSAEIVLEDPFAGFREMDPKPEAVLFSFLDPEFDAAAFGSLTLRSWDTRNPADIYEITFATALDALAFLDDGRLLFGGVPRARHLEIILETTSSAGDFFLDLVVAAVPEPSLAALLVLALLAPALGPRVVASRPS